MLHLALRNIRRNRRRTLLTIFLATSGSFLMGIYQFFAYGITQDMILQAIRLNSGFLEVAAYGWNERPTLDRALEIKPGLLDELKVEGVRSISPRIKSGALLNSGEQTRFVSILAADPVREEKITSLHNVITGGGRLVDRPGTLGALLGFRLARSLGIEVGDQLFLVSSQLDGSLGAIEVEVVGIYQANNSQLDTGRVTISLEAGRELFGNEIEGRSYYTSLALEVPDYLTAERVEELLQEQFPTPVAESGITPGDSLNYDPVVLDWQKLNPGIMEVVRMATVKVVIFLLLLVITLSFGILNSVQMSIQERLRELGVMMAIGTRRRSLITMVAMETTLLVAPAVLLGILLSTIPSYYFYLNPIDISGTAVGEIYESMGARSRIRPMVKFSDIWYLAAAFIIPAMGASLFAARRILRLDPIRIINTI